MKLLEFMGYIKLPDDFKGDEVDALQWYVDYRRSGVRTEEFIDIAKTSEEISVMTSIDYMGKIYKPLMESSDKVRGGNFHIYEQKDGKWVVINKG